MLCAYANEYVLGSRTPSCKDTTQSGALVRLAAIFSKDTSHLRPVSSPKLARIGKQEEPVNPVPDSKGTVHPFLALLSYVPLK